MSGEHLIRKAILICQASALANSMTDGEIMAAIKYVYDSMAKGISSHAFHEQEHGAPEIK